jgi:hypothetical protein
MIVLAREYDGQEFEWRAARYLRKSLEKGEIK